MNINQTEPKIADTRHSKHQKYSDTSVQMNIDQIKRKIADRSRAKYQKFWYLSPDEY